MIESPPLSAHAETPGALAAAWWEPNRIGYNAVLLVVFGALAARTWARLAPELSFGNCLRLLVLAAIANACYTAAYPADLAMQSMTDGRPLALARRALWTAGTLFSVLVETYWFLDEILPPVQ
jgi:hypothetical protein